MNGVHAFMGEVDGRVACCPRTCGSCDRCSGGGGGGGECCDQEIAKKNRVCKETDQGSCLLPRLNFADIIAGRERALGESSAAVTHGNHKWKNPGQHMWQLKQKGKDPKFWAKKNGWRRRQRSRRARRRSRRRLLSGRAAPPRAEVEEAERGKANHRDIRSNSTSPNHWM